MAEEILEKKESMEDFKEELESSFRKLSEGDIVTGTVIALNEEEVTLDLKYFASGIIKAKDISDDPDFRREIFYSPEKKPMKFLPGKN